MRWACSENLLANLKISNLLVVGEVLVEVGPRQHARFLQFDYHSGPAIDEATEVGPACVEATDDGELADQQEVIVLRV